MSENIDHDILIRHDQKLAQICSSLHKMDEKIDKLSDKIDNNSKTYITKRIFLSINGIIIALLISLFAYTATINDQVIKNTVCIEKLESK